MSRVARLLDDCALFGILAVPFALHTHSSVRPHLMAYEAILVHQSLNSVVSFQ